MSCRRRGYLAGVLGYGRIQVFLDSYPEKSGFKGFPDLLISISGKPLVCRTCRSASRGNHWFAGLAGRHLGETTGFPDLLISISGKPVVSPTCYFTLSSLQSAEKYFGLRSSRRAASARLPPVFRSALSMMLSCR